MACKSIISHIQAQAERVIAQHEKLESELATVVSERDSLKAEVQRLRLTQSLGGNTADKAKSRARINLLLREVDKCIALLTKAE